MNAIIDQQRQDAWFELKCKLESGVQITIPEENLIRERGQITREQFVARIGAINS